MRLPGPLAPGGLLVLAACAAGPAGAPSSPPTLDHELAAIVDSPAAPLVGLSVLVVRDGGVIYQRAFGRRHVGTARTADLPLTERTLYRVASISKLVLAVAVMRLVEQGVLRLDDDVSDALGWPLRNPHFPQRPITLRLLLTHRSSLADAEPLVYPADVALREALEPGGRFYRNGIHWRRDAAPGERYAYVNLNSAVIATVMERATGERFDRLMHRLVLAPLGLRGGYDPSTFAAEDLADIATLYRKRREVDGRELWFPDGPWVVQADDLVSAPPAPLPGLAQYRIGSNGTLFGPQGRLRISVSDLGVLMRMLLAGGRHQGTQILRPETVRLMASEQWRVGDEAPGGENVGACSWGLGVQRFTDTCAKGRGDRLVEGGGFTGWGHSGDAYGLMGLFVLDPDRRRGVIVVANGPGVDPATFPSRWSAFYRWQELAFTAVVRHLFDRPQH